MTLDLDFFSEPKEKLLALFLPPTKSYRKVHIGKVPVKPEPVAQEWSMRLDACPYDARYRQLQRGQMDHQGIAHFQEGLGFLSWQRCAWPPIDMKAC